MDRSKQRTAIVERLALLVKTLFDNNQSAFARACGVIPNVVCRWLSGDSLPRVEALVQLADIGINIHWLLTGENPVPVSDAPQKTSARGLILRLRTDLSRLEAELAEDTE